MFIVAVIFTLVAVYLLAGLVFAIPFVTKGVTGAQSWTSVVTKVEHNVPIDPKVFVKPAGK